MARTPNIPMPDLTGKRAVVTGGNSGLGFETTKRLLAAGADVVFTSRSAESGASALRRLETSIAPEGASRPEGPGVGSGGDSSGR